MAKLTGIAALLLPALAGPALAQDESAASDDAAPAVTIDTAPSAAVDPAAPPALDDSLTLPPELEAGPGDVRLEPPPEAREDVLEAVVTGGQSDWRLPDLGSSFRRDEEEIDPSQRISVQFLPLYDPENEDPTAELFPSIEDLRRVGFLEIIRVNFGRRSRD